MKDTDSDSGLWMIGTEAIAICMICGGEYAPDTLQCPDCDVSLSIVRRCPGCNRIVSARHTKCVYCRIPFQHELPDDLATAMVLPSAGQRARKRRRRLYRAAAVSILTFAFVFALCLMFTRRMNRPTGIQLRTLATSNVIRATQLRRTPSFSSSIAGEVGPGNPVNLVGFAEGEQGQRWITLAWNNSVAYVLARDVTPPIAVVAGGANVLKFYLSGMDKPETIDAAISAVDGYAKMFPSDIHNGELRWLLAERIRYVAQHAGSEEQAALRSEAHRQYEQLATSDGTYAGKARNVLDEVSPAPQTESPAHSPSRKTDELQVVGGSGTQTSYTQSAAHEVMLLNRAEVVVRLGQISQLVKGATIQGRLARPVKANGIVAIPGGARCEIKVFGRDNTKIILGLISIDLEHRSYPVNSIAIEVSSRGIGRQPADRALVFRLDAPLVIER